MDSLITAAAGDPLGALNRVALRDTGESTRQLLCVEHSARTA